MESSKGNSHNEIIYGKYTRYAEVYKILKVIITTL